MWWDPKPTSHATSLPIYKLSPDPGHHAATATGTCAADAWPSLFKDRFGEAGLEGFAGMLVISM
jgi:hypothetical protein